MNFIFLVLVLMPRLLKDDFLQEGIIRTAMFFASFTCLCNSNQDPAQELWTQKKLIQLSLRANNHYLSWKYS